ncbi:hypothetical protein [Rhodobacter sp. NSM]|uniref:hypothetical protein n=1 Tax=Rhodobacter sp. NSM TaxID=3457501 RepID=UPI003FD01CAC
MSGAMSRARQIAETAFNKTQSQFLNRARTLQKQDAELSERANKTHRLRIARLEREQAGRATSSLPSKKQRANPA